MNEETLLRAHSSLVVYLKHVLTNVNYRGDYVNRALDLLEVSDSAGPWNCVVALIVPFQRYRALRETKAVWAFVPQGGDFDVLRPVRDTRARMKRSEVQERRFYLASATFLSTAAGYWKGLVEVIAIPICFKVLTHGQTGLGQQSGAVGVKHACMARVLTALFSCALAAEKPVIARSNVRRPIGHATNEWIA